jgi:hypothetical protein
MHVQSCTFNFLFKFRNSIEFYGFLGDGRGGNYWHESTRSIYIEMLEVASNQYDISIWHVDMYLLAWRSFSKLGSFIQCSLKSFPSAFILDNLVVNYYPWWIFGWILFHFFPDHFKRWKSFNWDIVFELVLHHLMLQFKIIDENYWYTKKFWEHL